MIKGVRELAMVTGEYRQNPVEWLNYLTKREIDAQGGKDKHHHEATIPEAVNASKTRVLRLFGNAARALYDDTGPYIVSPPYSKFIVPYDRWMDMSEQERNDHIRKFFTYVPSDEDIRQLEAPFNEQQNVQNSAKNSPEESDGSFVSNIATAEKQHFRVRFTPEDVNITEYILTKSELNEIIRRAETLLNSPNSIMRAASNNPRVFTVKSEYGDKSLIVQPSPKCLDNLFCQCKVLMSTKICHHTVAVSVHLGIWFTYLVEARKRIMGSKKKLPDLTAATEYNLKSTEKGKKLNEIRKSNNRSYSKSFTTNQPGAMKRSSVSTSLSKAPESYPVASHEVPFPPSDNAGASSTNYEQSATQRIVPISHHKVIQPLLY